MIPRRSFWLWSAAAVVCLAGTLAGPAIYAVVETVWMAFQPRTLVSGWDVIALLALFGLIWLGTVYAVARGLRGKAAVVFQVVAITAAGAAVLCQKLQPAGEVTRLTLTGDEAAPWRETIDHDLPHPRRRP